MLAGSLEYICVYSEAINLKKLHRDSMHTVNATIIIEDALVKYTLYSSTKLSSCLLFVKALVNFREQLYEDFRSNSGISLD